MKKNWNKTAKWTRLALLFGLLLWVTYEAYMHQVLGGGKSPSIHALCPFGGLESLYALLFSGSMIKKIYSGTVVLLAVTVLLAILFRRSFCGLLCPFGALQELFARIGKKVFGKQYTVPQKVDKPLRYLKYVILVLTVVMAWITGTLWMSPYDPYAAFGHLSAVADSISEEPAAIVGFMLLAVTIIGSLLYDRFFCKYLCPAGAVYGILGKLSPTSVQRDDNLCVNCKACSKACPVNIDVAKEHKVTSAECISCNECVLVCPKKGALEVKTAGRTLHPMAMLLIVAGLFFGSIMLADATGNFQMLPSEVKQGQTISVSELKGYYTIEDAATATGLTLEQIYEKMDIPTSVSKDTKMKEISKEVPGFSFDEAKAKAGEN